MIQETTKKIVWEICVLVLLTLPLYIQIFNLCWELTADMRIVQFVTIVLLLCWGVAVIKYPMKNIYIKIALIYVTVVILTCLIPIALFCLSAPW
jgi:hypothetical protein